MEKGKCMVNEVSISSEGRGKKKKRVGAYIEKKRKRRGGVALVWYLLE
jgi:hypothetical protein